jgi:hypothetical protein
MLGMWEYVTVNLNCNKARQVQISDEGEDGWEGLTRHLTGSGPSLPLR